MRQGKVGGLQGRVLIVGGSDSSGGAGIQADIKTVTALGAYAAAAVTALTAQNTRGVFEVAGVEPDFVARQMNVVLEDIGADCIKTGMLHTAAVAEAVCGVIEEEAAAIPLVVDPVMIAKGGHELLDHAAVDVLKSRLIGLAAVLTPNVPEAEVLAGMDIGDVGDMRRAAETLVSLGAKAVLLKGGHVAGDVVTDLLLWEEGEEIIASPRIDTSSTHGTGCTLASAIAAGLAQKMGPRDAVLRARKYLQRAIETAPALGRGHGPLNHCHNIPRFAE